MTENPSSKSARLRDLAAREDHAPTREIYIRLAESWEQEATKGRPPPLATPADAAPSELVAALDALRVRVTALETALAIAISLLRQSSPQIAKVIENSTFEPHPNTPKAELPSARESARRVRWLFGRPAEE